MIDKKKRRAQAIAELVSIRNIINREHIGYRIAQEGSGNSSDEYYDLFEKPPETAPDPLQNMETLRSILLGQIVSKKNLYWAQGFWSPGNLLGFTMEQRSTICKTLVDISKAMGIKPKSTWLHVLKDPTFFEDWAQEVYGMDDETHPSKVLPFLHDHESVNP